MRTAIVGFGPGKTEKLAAALPAAGLVPACACGPGPRPAGLPAAVNYRKDAAEVFSKEDRLELAVVSAAGGAALALRALENRLHVICEPPLAFSSTEFEKLRSAAAAAGLALGALQPWERTAAWQAVEKALNGNLLGELFLAGAEISLEGHPPKGGVTAAAGWQAFAMLLASVRRPPSGLTARLSPEPEKGADRSDARAALLVHFPSADGAAHIACGAHAAGTRFLAAGDKGRLELYGDLLRLDVKGLPPETVRLRDALAGAEDRADLLAAELSDFAKEIRKELPAGSSLRNAKYCARLMKNAYYSAALRSAAVPV